MHIQGLKCLYQYQQIPIFKNDIKTKKQQNLHNNELIITDEEQSKINNISKLRLMTGILTDEQIEQINKTGLLPDNAKFIFDGQVSRYYVANNFFGIRAGTQTLPEGFEVKKNLIGQAVAVPKNSKSIFIQ